MFMQPEISHGTWIEIDGPAGVTVIPGDLVGNPTTLEALADYYDGTDPETFERVNGWGARLSAPGYLDCTDWDVYPTKQAAIDGLLDAYCDCIDAEPCDLCQALKGNGS